MGLMAYINAEKKESLAYIQGILEQRDILLWNYAAFSAVVFLSLKKHLQALIESGKIDVIALPVAEENQAVLDRALRRGKSSRALRKAIENELYPAALPKSEKQLKIWFELIKLVYQHNLSQPEKKIKLLAIPSVNSTPEQMNAAVQRIINTTPAGKKAVILKYFMSWTTRQTRKHSRVYNLLHLDPDIGFTENKMNSFSYAVNYLMSERSGDFVIETENAPFKDEEILPVSEESWKRDAIEALKAVNGGRITPEAVREIEAGFRLMQQQGYRFAFSEQGADRKGDNRTLKPCSQA
jgi:hypothetical protein